MEASLNTPTKSDPYRIHMRALGAAALIFFCVHGYFCVNHAAWEIPRPDVARDRKVPGSDFTAYYSAGELARRGANIYDSRLSSTPGRPYFYPPIFAIFPMVLLSLLSHNGALSVFYVLNIAMLLCGVWLLWRILWDSNAGTPLPFWRRPELGAFFSVAGCWRFLDSNMKLGNANMYIFFLLALALYLIIKKAAFLGGVAVALATTYKLTPGLFGLYFLWSWRRASMLGGALGLILFLLVLPAPFLGVTGNWNTLVYYATQINGKILSGKMDESKQDENTGVLKSEEADEKNLPRADGASLPATIIKLLSRTQASHGANVMALSPKTVKTVANVCALMLLIASVVLTLPRWTGAGVYALSLSWSLMALTMVLIAPLTRIAHLVVLVLPVFVLIAMLQQNLLQGARKKLAWISLVALPLTGPLSSEGLLGKGGQMISALGLTTWVLLFLFVTLGVVLWGIKPVEIQTS